MNELNQEDKQKLEDIKKALSEMPAEERDKMIDEIQEILKSIELDVVDMEKIIDSK